MLTGVKASKDGRMFISLPRWNLNAYGNSLPATFFEIKDDIGTNNPLLIPYPSWELNRVIPSG